MTLTFWAITALLMILVAGLLCWPVLRRSRSTGKARSELNAAVYRSQFDELARDRDLDNLTEADYQAAKADLERRILDEAEPAPAARSTTVRPDRFPRTVPALLVIIPATALPLYFWLGNPEAINHPAAAPHAQQMADQKPDPEAEKMEKFIAEFAAKMEKNPENTKGWIMLARSYKALGRIAEAERAFARVGPLMDTEPSLLLDRVELDSMKHDGRIEGPALALLNKVLEKSPDNPQGLVLAGTGAFYRKDFTGAVQYWERLLKLVPPDSEDAKNLKNGIANARARMGAPMVNAAAPPEAPSRPAEKPQDSAKTAISGRVELASALRAKISPDDTLFIFARAVNGSRMPLAIIRSKASSLPLDFTLDDSLAMSPAMKISGAAEVRVEARISKSGQALPQPGDFTGSSGVVKPGATQLKIAIDQVVGQ